MACKMNGWSPFTKMSKHTKIPGGKERFGVTRKYQEKSEGEKSKWRKKIESGKGFWAKLLGGKRVDDTYKPGIADFRLFGGVGHRNLKQGDSAANVKKKHSKLNWKS